MEWFANDDFWTTFAPYIFSEERLRSAPDDVARVLALANTSQPDVLDLCCGTGRHAVEFARRGCRVTAVDRTRLALDLARGYAADAGVDVECFGGLDGREYGVDAERLVAVAQA